MQDLYLADRPTFVSTTLFFCKNNEYREISKAKFYKRDLWLLLTQISSHIVIRIQGY